MDAYVFQSCLGRNSWHGVNLEGSASCQPLLFVDVLFELGFGTRPVFLRLCMLCWEAAKFLLRMCTFSALFALLLLSSMTSEFQVCFLFLVCMRSV